MKAEQKRVGTKAKIRAEKERQRRITTRILLAIILLAIALSAYFAYTIISPYTQDQPSGQNLNKPSLQSKPENPNSQLKAAIVDQISLTLPNQTFIQTATSTLTSAGYTVDYFSGEKVTVNFYRNLPAQGYGLIILRVHSTAALLAGGQLGEMPVSFFTSEYYSQTKYVLEQETEQLLKGFYDIPNTPYYFGITPKFVRASMNGVFQRTTVVMMGCQGLNNTGMAEAFIEEGAKVYIGWTSSVSASYTDQATDHLLRHLITENQTIGQAVGNTMKEVGPDESYNNILEYYPLESGDYSIQR
jgi:hypothetical protein